MGPEDNSFLPNPFFIQVVWLSILQTDTTHKQLLRNCQFVDARTRQLQIFHLAR